MSDNASITPAGWYPDPADDARLRRWDGAKWTQDVIIAPRESPVAAPAPPAPVPPPRASAPPQPQRQPTRKTDSQSGPISMPEWANLPGITLPPDLSEIGLEPDTILHAPEFEEPDRVQPPGATDGAGTARPSTIRLADSVLPPPLFTPAPEPAVFVRPAPEPRDQPPQPAATQPTSTGPSFPPPAPPRRIPTPAQHYAPPPSGAHYDVPPPPGAASGIGAGIALPASSLIAPHLEPAAWAAGPPIDRGDVPPVDFDSLPRTSVDPLQVDVSSGTLTVWAWLIAALPLIQFLVVYLVFAQLGVAFSAGMQWGILAAPAAFGLLFASGDRRKLDDLGADRAPSPLLAIVPPIYLLVRAFDVGRSSAGLLVAWILLQLAAAAGVYFLMPHILAQATAGL